MSETGYRVQNPATGEVVERFETLTDEALEAVLEAAARAQRSWAETPIENRAAVVRRVAALFEERKEELAAIIGEEMGKRVTEGREEAEFSSEIFGYYADHGPSFAADQPVETASGTAVIERRPVGVVLGIMPWNFPYYQVARFAAPNLVLGNGIVLKHAEICPCSALAIAQIMEDAGLPEGVYSTIFASHQQVSEIIADRRIAGVSLTGSERAGAQVAAQAGAALKKAVLELGGSDPYVVLDADDVSAAAELAWGTRMYNTGQACNSNKRLIVMDDIYDEFVEALVGQAQAMRPGQWSDEDAQVYQPLSSRAAAVRLREQLDRIEVAGGTVRTGGELVPGDGAYVSPAVVTDVPVGSEVYYEELFGPVAAVFRVSSDEEALDLANDTRYGLGGTVFSADEERARRMASSLEVGMANVNTPAGEGAELPFGGVKNSGYGRELGPVGMDEFVNKRLFYVEG